MNSTAWYDSVDIITYCWTFVCVNYFWLLTSYDNTWAFGTKTQHIFTVRQNMLIWWKGTQYCHRHVLFCFLYMTTMWHHIIIIGFKNVIFIEPDRLLWLLWIWSLILFMKQPLNFNKEECTLLEDMQK